MFPFIVFKVVYHFDAFNSPQFVKDLVRYIPSVLGRKEGMLQGIILSTQRVWPFTMGLGFNGNGTLGSMQRYYAMKGNTQKEGESGKKAQSV
jgi:hypothetical protein